MQEARRWERCDARRADQRAGPRSDRLGRARHRRDRLGFGGRDDGRLGHARARGDHFQAGVKGPIDDGGREAFGENHAGGESCVAHAETIGEAPGSSNQGGINVAMMAADRARARVCGHRGAMGVVEDTLDVA
ncbi:hypothetical protein [Nannocystis exedens]|uniref:hypothetical protein n=1 Tax=Nannocystis exedens TaxID=54 RepID=UPI00117BF31C|nr:hypothetical protein [Nannocystis exedens]